MAATQTPASRTQGVTRATVRYLHVSPYKIRQVLELVRGLPVEDAERVLQLCEKDAADHVQKLLRSATANAEHNLAMEADELYISGTWCDEGPTRKAGRARARGRYFRIRKRTSHVTIVLDRYDVEELQERRRREEASGRGAAAAQRSRAERVRRSRQATEAEEAVEDDATATATEDDVTTAEATVASGAAGAAPAAGDSGADTDTDTGDETAPEAPADEATAEEEN